MKVVVPTVIGVLQVSGALWLYHRLGIAPPSWLGTAHRISGTVTLALSLFVAYHCLFALGLESGRSRTARRCRCARSSTASAAAWAARWL